MNLPEGWEGFYQDVCNKVKTLSSCGIWKISSATALAWLGNFQESEHKYIAAHILDRVTYRSEKMIEAAYKSFLISTFREHIKTHKASSNYSIDEWLKLLRSHPRNEHSNIKLCSVSKLGDNGDSGSQVIRLLTGELFHQNRMISPEKEPLRDLEGQIILIVDDFVGSGDQFISFAEETGLRQACKNNHIIYAPAIGYYKGLEKITKADFGISLSPLEILKNSERFFTHEPGAAFCGDNINTEAEVAECYRQMLKLSPSFNRGAWFGRDNESLCVIFQWGCPNQSLGIIWYEGGSDWKKLARRRGSQ